MKWEMTVDNRKDIRINIDMKTQISSKGKGFGGEGHLRDLSINGCRIVCESPLPKGAEVKMSIFSREFSQPVIINCATVRWKKKDENGIVFNELRGDAKKQLNMLCRRIIL